MSEEDRDKNGREDAAERERLYRQHRDELIELRKLDADKYDNAILTLSAALLAISVTFISNVFPLDTAVAKPVLYMAWGGFSLAIVVAIGGFIFSQRDKERQIRAADEFYRQSKEEAWRTNERIKRRTDVLNCIPGGGALYRTLRSTNMIENLNGSVATYTRNVKRWRGGSMILRWVSAAVLDASQRFRRIRGYRELEALPHPRSRRSRDRAAALRDRPAGRPPRSGRVGESLTHGAAALEVQHRTGHRRASERGRQNTVEEVSSAVTRG